MSIDIPRLPPLNHTPLLSSCTSPRDFREITPRTDESVSPCPFVEFNTQLDTTSISVSTAQFDKLRDLFLVMQTRLHYRNDEVKNLRERRKTLDLEQTQQLHELSCEMEDALTKMMRSKANVEAEKRGLQRRIDALERMDNHTDPPVTGENNISLKKGVDGKSACQQQPPRCSVLKSSHDESTPPSTETLRNDQTKNDSVCLLDANRKKKELEMELRNKSREVQQLKVALDETNSKCDLLSEKLRDANNLEKTGQGGFLHGFISFVFPRPFSSSASPHRNMVNVLKVLFVLVFAVGVITFFLQRGSKSDTVLAASSPVIVAPHHFAK